MTQCILAWGLILGMVIPNSMLTTVAAQTTIGGRAVCRSCSVHLERVTRIGGIESEVDGETVLVARDSKGRVAIASESRSHEIVVFLPQGRLLKKIGRKGTGPGEFENIRGIRFDTKDSLHVYDVALGRITVYDPELRLRRSLTAPALANSPNGFWPMPKGGYLVNAAIRSRDRSGLPLHILDGNGVLVRSFGSDGSFRSDFGIAWQRRAALVGGVIWTMNLNEYMVEGWNDKGSRTMAVRREGNWFKSWWRHPPAELPTPPFSIGLDVDAGGRVWTVTLVPATDQAKFKRIERLEREMYATWTDHEKAFDSIVDVIDPTRGHVIATTRVDQKLIAVLGNGYFAGYRQKADGVGFIDIWRAQMRQVEQSPNTLEEVFTMRAVIIGIGAAVVVSAAGLVGAHEATANDSPSPMLEAPMLQECSATWLPLWPAQQARGTLYSPRGGSRPRARGMHWRSLR